jgi:putative modified peptide
LAKKGKTYDLGDDRIEQFMRRLATDDEFREAMERDPAATLVGAGVSPAKEGMPKKKVKLPTKAALKARLKKLKEKKRGSDAVHIPFNFNHVIENTCEEEEKPPKPPKPPRPPKPKPKKAGAPAKKPAKGGKKGK